MTAPIAAHDRRRRFLAAAACAGLDARGPTATVAITGPWAV